MNLKPREPGDLLEIVEAGDWKRLTADDYRELIPLRDHYARRFEQVDAMVRRCPVPNPEPEPKGTPADAQRP